LIDTAKPTSGESFDVMTLRAPIGQHDFVQARRHFLVVPTIVYRFTGLRLEAPGDIRQRPTAFEMLMPDEAARHIGTLRARECSVNPVLADAKYCMTTRSSPRHTAAATGTHLT
jgi:hypothetical protein